MIRSHHVKEDQHLIALLTATHLQARLHQKHSQGYDSISAAHVQSEHTSHLQGTHAL